MANYHRLREKMHSDEKVAMALEVCGGNLSKTLKLLGYKSYQTFRVRVMNTPALREAMIQGIERQKDFAETKLQELVDQGNFNAIQFYLKSKARDRGYGDSIMLEVNAKTNSFDLKQLSDDELRQLEQLAAKAQGATEEGDNATRYLPEGNIIEVNETDKGIEGIESGIFRETDIETPSTSISN